jgi:cyclophilin family peptidyl-prolyl cis-trans isomerase
MRRRANHLIAGGISVLLFSLVVLVSCAEEVPDLPDGLYARIDTNKGMIIVKLEPDRMPLTTMNFVGLAEGTITHSRSENTRFYDGLTFHRVVDGFVVQGGDPNGNGSGGPGYRFATETHPDLIHDAAGVVAMANSGPDTNGSQFYITLDAAPWLDGDYNVFGHVVYGMDVVNSIEVGDVMEHVTILRIGGQAAAYRASDAQLETLKSEVAQRRAAEVVALREASLAQALERFPDAVMLDDTGLYLDRQQTTGGTTPEAGDRVAVHFVFELADGTQLDSTRDRGEPYEFVYMGDRLLPGLEQAIGTMAVGDHVVAIVPPELAFGPSGNPPVIGANDYVVFELERLR